MTHTLIFAGGVGQRMNTRAKPKQFLELRGKPVLIYTLEHSEFHPEVDGIAIVCQIAISSAPNLNDAKFEAMENEQILGV
jgi:2-C-methyl-D-erythritol 4-phosphate cytidylyltransferase